MEGAYFRGDFVACLEAIESEPDKPGSARFAALCCVRLGRVDEAVEKLDALLKVPYGGRVGDRFNNSIVLHVSTFEIGKPR
jgi:hypothetical protein